MPRKRPSRTMLGIRRFSAARFAGAPTVLALCCLLNITARAQVPMPAAADDPFATPAEKAAASAAPAAAADNPFATPEELGIPRPSLLMNREPLDIVVLKERPPREEEILPLDLSQRKVLAAANPNSAASRSITLRSAFGVLSCAARYRRDSLF